jgi:hypothetical protein
MGTVNGTIVFALPIHQSERAILPVAAVNLTVGDMVDSNPYFLLL